MSLFLGALLGTGLMLIWFSGFPARRHQRRVGALRRRLDAAGRARTPVAALLAVSVLLGCAVVLLVVALTSAWPVAVIFGAFTAMLPGWALGPAALRRARTRREAWPDVVDLLRSAVRAGVPLSEALAQLGRRGPLALRQEFLAYEADLRVGRSVEVALGALQARLADPTGDRLITAVRLTREVGGADVGELLSTLSQFLRTDLRTRGELEARQSWTVNAARLAVVAPWLILLVLCLQPSVAAAYATGTGVMVLAVGLAIAVAAYAAMVRVARLPDPELVRR